MHDTTWIEHEEMDVDEPTQQVRELSRPAKKPDPKVSGNWDLGVDQRYGGSHDGSRNQAKWASRARADATGRTGGRSAATSVVTSSSKGKSGGGSIIGQHKGPANAGSSSKPKPAKVGKTASMLSAVPSRRERFAAN